jgi:hypothetical protein
MHWTEELFRVIFISVQTATLLNLSAADITLTAAILNAAYGNLIHSASTLHFARSGVFCLPTIVGTASIIRSTLRIPTGTSVPPAPFGIGFSGLLISRRMMSGQRPAFLINANRRRSQTICGGHSDGLKVEAVSAASDRRST